MNLTVFVSDGEVFKSCENIKEYAFKMVATRGKAVHVVHDYATLRNQSTHLTATSAQLQDRSVDLTVFNASYHIDAS